WSSDVCSSDLLREHTLAHARARIVDPQAHLAAIDLLGSIRMHADDSTILVHEAAVSRPIRAIVGRRIDDADADATAGGLVSRARHQTRQPQEQRTREERSPSSHRPTRFILLNPGA